MRRLLLLAVLVCLVAVAGPDPAPAAVPVLVVDGRGFGHGVGMAQDGAYWMGKAGASTNQILGHFYPGTGLGKATGSVRVAVHTAPSREAIVAFPNGGEVRDARSGEQSAGFPVRVGPGGQIRIRFDGSRYTATALSGSQPTAAAAGPSPTAAPAIVASPEPQPATEPAAVDDPTATTTTSTTTFLGLPTTTLPEPTTTTTAPPDQPPPPADEPGAGAASPSSGRALVAVPADGGTVGVPARSHRYRGIVEAIGGAGALRLVNEVDVETYLKGMGEVRNPSWPPASLRAQAIAARTYALRAMAAAGELCDTQRCQVYLGAEAEYAAMNKAVNDSARQVIVFGRTMASTVYSANGGGFSASPPEGFGTTGAGYPYLRAARYDTKDPLPWTVQIALTDLRGRFAYPGQVSGARVTQVGPSGRALQVTLDGTAGPRVVTGLAFDAGLGLKSTLFSLQIGTADVAPAPPPPGEGLQALPEDVAAANEAATDGPIADLSDLGAKPGPLQSSTTGGGPSLPLGATAVALQLSAAAAVVERLLRNWRA